MSVMRVIGRILFLFNVTSIMRILDRTAWQNSQVSRKKALQKKGTEGRWGGTRGERCSCPPPCPPLYRVSKKTEAFYIQISREIIAGISAKLC